MIEPCPSDFWDRVAKLVAEKILIREASLAGANLAAAPKGEASISRGTAARIIEQFQPTAVPPEGPRAA